MSAARRPAGFALPALGGLWAESASPLSITFPAAADVHWASAGRRIEVVISPSAGLDRATSAGGLLLSGASATVDGATPPPASLVAAPTDVRRRFDGLPAVEERWATALELPICFWEIEAPDDAALRLEGKLGHDWARAEQVAPAAEAVRLELPDGRITVIMADGGELSLHLGASPLLVVAGRGRVRVCLIAASDAGDLDRTLQLASRKGFSGLQAQRAQHERLAREYGTSVSTPLPELDQAFEWGKVLSDAPRSAGQPADAGALSDFNLERVLQAPLVHAVSDPAGFVTGVLGTLWGIHQGDEGLSLAPRLPPGWVRMDVTRLRAGPTTLDAAVSRRAGRVTARLRRRNGAAINTVLSLPGEATTGLAVDGVALAGAEARFELSGEHEVTFDLAG